jgi:four helix bundle protein
MNYKDLTVWQKSMDLTTRIYTYTSKFPLHEQYGLTSQMRRAAVSIPSNIAEGSRRRGKDGRQFLLIAFGSGAELETQLELSRRLEYGESKEFEECIPILEEVMKMLNKMVNTKL